MPKVTPAEQVPLEISDNKQVRFINKDQASPPNKTQLRATGVSKRGRYVSPGRRIGTSSMQPSVLQSPSATQSDRVNGGVVEYRTYRSPDTSTVPSLCSAPSDQDGDSKIAASENQVSEMAKMYAAFMSVSQSILFCDGPSSYLISGKASVVSDTGSVETS
jgi:hypothetical protein